jgi:hypothetical protein
MKDMAKNNGLMYDFNAIACPLNILNYFKARLSAFKNDKYGCMHKSYFREIIWKNRKY